VRDQHVNDFGCVNCTNAPSASSVVKQPAASVYLSMWVILALY
jgi:hypothetical protein